MALFKVCIAACLLAILVSGMSQYDGSGSELEVCNPCSDTECPRYLNADCNAENCEAVFTWRGNNVTNKCNATTCDTQNCPANRFCVETVFPSSCPESDEQCRQFIRRRCILRPTTQQTNLTCANVECDQELTCHQRDTATGWEPVFRCAPTTDVPLMPGN